MKRRLLLLAGVPVWSPLAHRIAQAHALPRIGVLSFGSAPAAGSGDPIIGFAQGLRELGYEHGRNVVVEWRYAQGQAERVRVGSFRCPPSCWQCRSLKASTGMSNAGSIAMKK
jgi:putative ABC transport system substrate-binding protein